MHRDATQSAFLLPIIKPKHNRDLGGYYRPLFFCVFTTMRRHLKKKVKENPAVFGSAVLSPKVFSVPFLHESRLTDSTFADDQRKRRHLCHRKFENRVGCGDKETKDVTSRRRHTRSMCKANTTPCAKRSKGKFGGNPYAMLHKESTCILHPRVSHVVGVCWKCVQMRVCLLRSRISRLPLWPSLCVVRWSVQFHL